MCTTQQPDRSTDVCGQSRTEKVERDKTCHLVAKYWHDQMCIRFLNATWKTILAGK